MGVIPEEYTVLIVDDEADVHAMSKLALKKMTYDDKAVVLASAMNGAEAVDYVKTHGDVAVILMDVVMENNQAGLDACREIRENLQNDTVRILLRTGQPGSAPEKTVITDYEIDGYLAKAELTHTRLFTAVRTAIKAFTEIRTARWLDGVLTHLHQSANHIFLSDLSPTLSQIMANAVDVCPADLALLKMDFQDAELQSLVLFHSATEHDNEALAARIEKVEAEGAFEQAGPFDGGYLMPLTLPHEMGQGWLFLEAAVTEMAMAKALYLMANQATLAIYATVVQQQLLAYQGAELLDF